MRSIRSKDWLSFSQRYNGPRQKRYDLKMERNYNASL
ncbi:N-acetylmuramidase domain-containing protein [Enterobacter cloacae]